MNCRKTFIKRQEGYLKGKRADPRTPQNPINASRFSLFYIWDRTSVGRNAILRNRIKIIMTENTGIYNRR